MQTVLWFLLVVLMQSSLLANERIHPMVGIPEGIDGSGKLRPAYQAYQNRTGKHPLDPSDDQIRKLMFEHPKTDRRQIFAIPMILTEAEDEWIRRAVEQRARAMFKFFADVRIGQSKCIKEGIFTEQEIREIFYDEYVNYDMEKEVWAGKTEKDINFLYAPALFRDTDGTFKLLQDFNLSTKGLADSTSAGDFFSPSQVLRKSNVQVLVEEYLKSIDIKPHEQNVVAFINEINQLREMKKRDYKKSDSEGLRIAKILEAMSIKVLPQARWTVEESAAVFRNDDLKVILDFTLDVAMGDSYLFAKDLFNKKNIHFINTSASHIPLNAKVMVKMDALIRFYLHEEPLLKSLEVKFIKDESRLSELVADNSGFVIKNIGAGHQRHPIFFCGKEPNAKMAKLENIDLSRCVNSYFEHHRDQYMLQKFAAASYFNIMPFLYRTQIVPMGIMLGASERFVVADAFRGVAKEVNSGKEYDLAVFVESKCEHFL